MPTGEAVFTAIEGLITPAWVALVPYFTHPSVCAFDHRHRNAIIVRLLITVYTHSIMMMTISVTHIQT